MSRAIRILLVAVVGVATVFGACGGDDAEPLSAEEYFAELRELSEAASDAADDVGSEIGARVMDPDDELSENEIVALVYREIERLFRDYTRDIDALEPPEDLRDAHDALVSAYEDTADAMGVVAEGAADVESDQEGFALLAEFEARLEPALERCRELQDAADARDITIDLDCSGLAE